MEFRSGVELLRLVGGKGVGWGHCGRGMRWDLREVEGREGE